MTRQRLFFLTVYAVIVALVFAIGQRYAESPGGGSAIPAGAPHSTPTENPKCYLQQAKCATHQPTPAVGVGRCDRNPGQLNAGSCLPRRVPRYVPPAWLWRYMVTWTA